MASKLKDGEIVAVRVGFGDVNNDGEQDVNGELTFNLGAFGEHTIAPPPLNIPAEQALKLGAELMARGMAIAGKLPIPKL